jgi:hypothetical protein
MADERRSTMQVHHLSLRSDYGARAELTWDEARYPEALALSINERSLWSGPELRELARTLDMAADALESDSLEWRIELLRDAGFVERKEQKSAA